MMRKLTLIQGGEGLSLKKSSQLDFPPGNALSSLPTALTGTMQYWQVRLSLPHKERRNQPPASADFLRFMVD